MLTVAVFDKVGGPVEGMARLAELGIPGNMIVSMDTPLFEQVEGEGV